MRVERDAGFAAAFAAPRRAGADFAFTAAAGLRRVAAVDAGRSEEHDRVLNLLIREAAERFEIFGQDANRPRIGAFEELPVLVCERLLRHITPLYQL